MHNYGEEPAYCEIEVHFDCDFADLFEVKESRVEKAGDLAVDMRELDRHVHVLPGKLPAGRPHRLLGAADDHGPGRDLRRDHCPRQESWSLCVQLTPIIDEQPVEPRYVCGAPVEHATPERAPRGLAGEAAHASRPTTTRSSTCSHARREDLAALRLFDPEQPDRTVVAAGAPWFMTLFGRDSLITSWMAMLVDSDLALGTLQTLAQLQGRDAQPDHRGATRAHPPRDALRRERTAVARRRAASTTAASTPRRSS